MSRIPYRQLSLPISNALEGLSSYELEILHNRLKSRNYRPSSSLSHPATSLFDDTELVTTMIPKHFKINEIKISYKLQQQAKYHEEQKIERASRFLSPLPRLPDEVDLDDFLSGTVRNTPRERAMQIRGLRISNEIEKKLVTLLSAEHASSRLSLPDACWISRVKCNFELTKAVIYFSIKEQLDSDKLKVRIEEVKEKFEMNSKMIRFLIAKHVYLKRVPELEFEFDQMDLNESI